jgi:hypothetical protein
MALPDAAKWFSKVRFPVYSSISNCDSSLFLTLDILLVFENFLYPDGPTLYVIDCILHFLANQQCPVPWRTVLFIHFLPVCDWIVFFFG